MTQSGERLIGAAREASEIVKSMNDEWQPIETAPVKEEVILCWVYPDYPPEMRFGRLLYKPIDDDHPPRFKLELNYGDTDCIVYTNKDDVPVVWRHKPSPPMTITGAK